MSCVLLRRCAVLGLVVWLAGPSALAENWPQWRGPRHDGTSLDKNLPLSWSETANIAWRCPLPEAGVSTPVVWGDALFVTTQADNKDLLLLKINRRTGKIEWTRQVGVQPMSTNPLQGKGGEMRRHQSFHQMHRYNYAIPSAATDGAHVVAHFANGDLAVYDFAGKQLWRRNLQKDYGDYTVWWGHSNSPILYRNLVITVCIQDNCADLPGPQSPSYVVAHDVKTGQEVWKTLRETTARLEPCDSYATPILWDHNGRTELVVWGGLILDAYDPLDGKRLWQLPERLGNRTITGPVAWRDMVFATQGMRYPVLAVRPGGDGLRGDADIVWQSKKDTPDSATPVVADGWLFLVNNNGKIQCVNAATGEVQWQERLRGDYRASPLAGAGRIYILSTTGRTTVVAAKPQFEKLAENLLDDETLSSPIAVDGQIYIRGRKTLYCIGK